MPARNTCRGANLTVEPSSSRPVPVPVSGVFISESWGRTIRRPIFTLTWVAPATHVSAEVGGIPENTSTTPPVKVANLSAKDADFDDTPKFEVIGTDASDFEVVARSLFLKLGTDLSTQSSYKFKIRVTSGGVSIESIEKTLKVGTFAAVVVSAPSRP